jgi:hypothetical protein
MVGAPVETVDRTPDDTSDSQEPSLQQVKLAYSRWQFGYLAVLAA